MVKREKRPDCPECNSPNPVKNGASRWLCKKCGHQWLKPRPKKEVDYTGRPSCLECGSKRMISWGEFWRCKDCGRSVLKHLRKKQSFSKIYLDSIKSSIGGENL